MAARLSLEDRPIAEVTLLVLLVQTAIIAAAFILLPLLLSRSNGQWSASWHSLIYFAALGLAFIMVEVASLQHFLLFLGQPIYTYAVVLATLLIFTGLGSFFSERLPASVAVLRRVLPLIVLIIATWSLLTPAVFHLTLGLPLAARVFIAVALVAPLGFVLGMPFPLGLRIAVQKSAALGAWARTRRRRAPIAPCRSRRRRLPRWKCGRRTFPHGRPEDYVFPTEVYQQAKGGEMVVVSSDPTKPVTSVQRSWETAKEEAGLLLGLDHPLACRFHDLRHTAITHMIENDVPLPVIAQLVGWSPSTTVQMAIRYGHFSMKTLTVAVEKIGAKEESRPISRPPVLSGSGHVV